MLYDELRAAGLSDEEACRRLTTDFDWGLNEVCRPILRRRTDEFAASENKRNEAAENGDDLAAMWLEAREKDNGSCRMLELLTGILNT